MTSGINSKSFATKIRLEYNCQLMRYQHKLDKVFYHLMPCTYLWFWVGELQHHISPHLNHVIGPLLKSTGGVSISIICLECNLRYLFFQRTALLELVVFYANSKLQMVCTIHASSLASHLMCALPSWKLSPTCHWSKICGSHKTRSERDKRINITKRNQ